MQKLKYTGEVLEPTINQNAKIIKKDNEYTRIVLINMCIAITLFMNSKRWIL